MIDILISYSYRDIYNHLGEAYDASTPTHQRHGGCIFDGPAECTGNLQLTMAKYAYLFNPHQYQYIFNNTDTFIIKLFSI